MIFFVFFVKVGRKGQKNGGKYNATQIPDFRFPTGKKYFSNWILNFFQLGGFFGIHKM